MTVLKAELEVNNSNKITSYFPARTTTNREPFDWGVAQGVVVRNLYKKLVNRKLLVKDEGSENYINLVEICKRSFEDRLDDKDLWPHLEKMYFSPNTFYKIAPECLLFEILGLSTNSSKNLLGDLFSSLMQDFYNGNPERIKRNFLEQQIVDSLRSSEVLVEFEGVRSSKGIEEEPYLPFLTNCFCEDIEFLSNHPGYLMENLEEFLKLYAYLYTSQLALNIRSFTSEPSSKPLYFIMENEVASMERLDLVKNGHQKVSKNIELIFPYLTMAETLQDVKKGKHRIPLWDFASKLTTEDTESLKEYAKKFAQNRSLSFDYDDLNTKPIYWLRELAGLSLRQFSRGETRAAAQGKFITATEVELCSTFVRSRGRVGKVLVINQDYLTLLTNLAIGVNDRLRFHDLLDKFKDRGVYFDKKTQQSLIKFYERVGNVVRMSDSGDAVYVRKTI
jgi:DNA phosphorothioation-dependent restriction protein DptG